MPTSRRLPPLPWRSRIEPRPGSRSGSVSATLHRSAGLPARARRSALVAGARGLCCPPDASRRRSLRLGADQADSGTPCCAADDLRGSPAASPASAGGPRRRGAEAWTWNLPRRTASWAGLPGPSEVSYYNSRVEIHPSARKHGIADDDIEHAMRDPLAIDDQDDDTSLYRGPA